MKIIVNRNIFLTTDEFFKSIQDNINYIEGISLQVLLTKDGIPIVMAPTTSEAFAAQVIKNVQSTNLNDIKDYEVLTLEEALNRLSPFNKKIIVNFIPISTTPFAQNIEAINRINQKQVEELYRVLDKYPNLNIYVASISHSIIYQIKKQNKRNKIGVVLSLYETTYIDVDFYIFSPNMLNYPILNQQLRLNKEVMVSSRSCEEMMIIYNFFNKLPNPQGSSMFNNISFISNHPLITYRLFN